VKSDQITIYKWIYDESIKKVKKIYINTIYQKNIKLKERK